MKDVFDRIQERYRCNELKFTIGFFVGGFVFDIFTLSDIDDLFSISQQIVYLSIIGFFFYFELIDSVKKIEMSHFQKRIWNYRSLIVHFLLGSLLSMYSLFFLKSASLFSSLIFILFLASLMVINELPFFQNSRLDLKIGLYVLCLFSFFSMLIPVALGFVGVIPFTLALLFTSLVIYFFYRSFQKRIEPPELLFKKLILPSGSVMILFVVFYLFGWIPPVPLAVTQMGIYHNVEKSSGQYILYYERPWWRFWHRGDQLFYAQPNDKVYFYAQIFSPARFDDSVILHWHFKDPKRGWLSTDKVPMKISGGRKEGFRGFSFKQNYQAGDWRISVETTDSREIGRIYFEVVNAPTDHERQLSTEIL